MGVPTPQYSTSATGRMMVWNGHQPPAYVDADIACALIGAVRAVRVRVYTASDTYIPDPHLLYAVIECQGAGGAGGAVVAAAGKYTVGSGGGAGGYAVKTASASDIGASQIVTIGAGGPAPAAGPNNGTNGGSTSVGALCAASGGFGGPYAQADVNVAGGGLAGAGSIGDLGFSGEPGGGGIGTTTGAGFIFPGWGGSSHFNGGPATQLNTDGTAGLHGAGGAGGQDVSQTTNRAGGAGGDGIVVITEFCSK